MSSVQSWEDRLGQVSHGGQTGRLGSPGTHKLGLWHTSGLGNPVVTTPMQLLVWGEGCGLGKGGDPDEQAAGLREWGQPRPEPGGTEPCVCIVCV